MRYAKFVQDSPTAHISQQDQQSSQHQAGQSIPPPAEQAGLPSSQSEVQEPFAAASTNADTQPSTITQTPPASADHSMASSAAAVGEAPIAVDKATTTVDEAATAVQCSSPSRLRPILTRRSNSCDVARSETMSAPAIDAGHLAAGQSGLQASGRANSMQSSPIYGLATAGSQAFSPSPDPTARVPKQGLH